MVLFHYSAPLVACSALHADDVDTLMHSLVKKRVLSFEGTHAWSVLLCIVQSLQRHSSITPSKWVQSQANYLYISLNKPVNLKPYHLRCGSRFRPPHLIHSHLLQFNFSLGRFNPNARTGAPEFQYSILAFQRFCAFPHPQHIGPCSLCLSSFGRCESSSVSFMARITMQIKFIITLSTDLFSLARILRLGPNIVFLFN